MKPHLMFKDRDFADLEVPPNAQALIQDLELNTLFDAMALGDETLLRMAKKTILSSLTEVESILYRQAILEDCLKNPFIIRQIYEIADDSIINKRRHYWGVLSRYPGSVLHGSTAVLQMLMAQLRKLREIADRHAGRFASEGFRTFFEMLIRELDDHYFTTVRNHLHTLQFRDGILIGAEIGQGNKGTGYTVRKSQEKKPCWFRRIFSRKSDAFAFHIAPRDEAGARALSELRDRGINLAANALAQSADHILDFFKILQIELAFYIGCLNLHEQLPDGAPVCFPLPAKSGYRRHSFRELYDVCLALTLGRKVVGNDLDADDKELMIITGANQGGKSTFLRSLGLAQVMLQCGMFVPARGFCSNICAGLFTHYRREEDTALKSGKLDEELRRMRGIADSLKPNSMLLFNESFAATNEREGSEIARQITYALLERQIKVFFVTHLYEFANSLLEGGRENAIFLRAERQRDGLRTFKIVEGNPLQTGYGEDLYNRIFVCATPPSEGCSTETPSHSAGSNPA